MDEKESTRLSKFLSLVLRHEPQRIGLELDSAGWAGVDDLIARIAAAGLSIDLAKLEHVVATNAKKRFAFSEDGTRIRASQGHSVDVDLGLVPVQPPELLFHGTAERNVEPIRAQGLMPMERRHVHLSPDAETARTVGARRGRPLVLVVAAGRMHADGFAFFRSDNGVWLTARVPPEFIEFPA